MADFLHTSVAYYVARAARRAAAASSHGGPPVDLPAPFCHTLCTVAAFVTEASEMQERLRKQEEEAAAAALAERAAELQAYAQETFAAIQAFATTLLPLVRDAQALPRDDLRALNAVIHRSESRYGACKKSEEIPEQLLAAEPGSKMYPHLAKKVEAICGRSLADVLHRESAVCKAHLLEGGNHEALDAQRAELARAWVHGQQELFLKHAEGLSESDHLPLHEAVQLGLGGGVLRVSSWNVMEFPLPGAAEPVLHGVHVSCTEMLRTLGRNNAADRRLLSDAMSSRAVILQHTDRVIRFIRESLEVRGSDVVLLQELGQDVQERVRQECESLGWSACFSASGADPAKCSAITGIVAKEPFDEEAQFEVVREGKARSFQAARRGRTWIVSCHTPLSSKKEAEEKDCIFAARVLEQLWRRFGLADDGSPAHTLVAGGDWNAHIDNVLGLALDAPLEGCPDVSAYALRCETCLCGYLQGHVSDAIDGVLCLHC